MTSCKSDAAVSAAVSVSVSAYQQHLHASRSPLQSPHLERVAAALALAAAGRTLPRVAFIKFDLCALSILKIIYKFYQIWYFFSV